MNLKLSTWENYSQLIRIHIQPALGHLYFKGLTTDVIQQLYTKLTERGAAPASIRRIHQVIFSAVRKAKEHKIISWNPAESVVLPKMSQRKVGPLTNEEMNNFSSCSETPGEPLC